MAASYAICRREPDGPSDVGELVLEGDALRLEGLRRQGEPASRRLPYRMLARVRVGRSVGERVGGRPTLNLECVDGAQIQITLMGADILSELADLLGSLVSADAEARTRSR